MWTCPHEHIYLKNTPDGRTGTIMKTQKAQTAGERKKDLVAVNQPERATSTSKPVGSLFDDLRRRITLCAYELNVQQGYREGCAVEDWLDAEREIVSPAFSVSAGSGRSPSLCFYVGETGESSDGFCDVHSSVIAWQSRVLELINSNAA
jgi:DUF2934 family protein